MDNELLTKINIIVIIILVTLLISMALLFVFVNYKSNIVYIQEDKPVKMIDPVLEYDYNKLNNPLEYPNRRVSRDELPPAYFKHMIDFPTRGFPDNFTQFGILVRIDHHGEEEIRNDNSNKILRLFGRQQYPGSNRYDYYTMVQSGFDNIKIPIDSRKSELYDGDEVFVREIKNKYRVQLHDYDAPKYYPDLF